MVAMDTLMPTVVAVTRTRQETHLALPALLRALPLFLPLLL